MARGENSSVFLLHKSLRNLQECFLSLSHIYIFFLLPLFDLEVITGLVGIVVFRNVPGTGNDALVCVGKNRVWNPAVQRESMLTYMSVNGYRCVLTGTAVPDSATSEVVYWRTVVWLPACSAMVFSDPLFSNSSFLNKSHHCLCSRSFVPG